MARNKYAKDYVLKESFTESGKVRTEYEYIGKRWEFAGEGPTAGEKRLAFLVTAAGWFCCIGSMIPYSRAMHALYAALPAAFGILPLALITGILLKLRQMKPPFEHRHADQLNNNYPAACIALVLLSLFAFAGGLALLISGAVSGELSLGDFVFAALQAAVFLCGLWLFGLRKKLFMNTC